MRKTINVIASNQIFPVGSSEYESVTLRQNCERKITTQFSVRSGWSVQFTMNFNKFEEILNDKGLVTEFTTGQLRKRSKTFKMKVVAEFKNTNILI